MEHKLYETYRNVEQKHWWFVGRRKILFNVLKKYLPGKGKILDVGCNTGVLVELLQKRGYDAFGTDISQESIEYGKNKGIKNLFAVDGYTYPFPDNSFDCLTALDVIEHIEDDKAVLREFRRLLKPGGLLIIKVPAFMFLWGIQDSVSQHKRRYTKKSLVTLIQSHGLQVLRTTYFNSFLFIPILISRFIQKIIPPRRGSDFDLNNRFVNYIFKNVFLFEGTLLRLMNLPVGVSILSISKK